MGLKDRFTNSTVELRPKAEPQRPGYKWPCAPATLAAVEAAEAPVTERYVQDAVVEQEPETHPFHVTCALLELQHKGLVTKVHGRFTRCP